MAHIMYDRTKPISSRIANVVNSILSDRAELLRIKTALDEMTAGGTVLANLETSGTMDGQSLVGCSVGNGATLYSSIVSIKSGLDSISGATLGDLDLG